MAKQKSLKQKAASGMVWTSVQKFSKMGIQFILGIVLARLLTPFDYGCIGMLAIFMTVAETFIDGGFGSALIQKKRPTQTDYSTIFWWNLALSVVMYAILFFSAPAIARFYEIPLLRDVLRVQGLILFIYALNLIQRNQLKKQLKFKILAIVRIVTSLVSLVITITMAYMGFGVWALVTQFLLGGIVPAIFFWFYIKWRPSLVFSWESFKKLFNFGFFMFLTHLVNSFCSKLTGLLIGKIYSPQMLGYYSKAMRTEGLASNTLSSVLTSITYPLYSEVQDDKKRLANMIKRLTTSIAYVTFPFMFLMMLIAKPVFVLLYSDRWLASVPFFQILCLIGLADCLQAVNTQSIAAIGKSKTMFYWTLIKRSFGLTFIIGGLYFFGMWGLLTGVVMYNWFCYFVNIGLVSKHIGYKWTQQLLDLAPMLITSALFASIAYFGVSMLHLGLYSDGILKFIIFLSLYLGYTFIVKPGPALYLLTIIPSKFKFWEHKKQNK